jgi:hypothetical protein
MKPQNLTSTPIFLYQYTIKMMVLQLAVDVPTQFANLTNCRADDLKYYLKCRHKINKNGIHKITRWNFYLVDQIGRTRLSKNQNQNFVQ